MSTRDTFAPGGRQYEKRKAQRKTNRRRGPGVSGARAVKARNSAIGKAKATVEESSSDSSEEEVVIMLTRKEREEIDRKQKHEAYLKATREGKTPEGRADLARLKEIKARREATARKKDRHQQKEEARKLAAKQLAINGGRRLH